MSQTPKSSRRHTLSPCSSVKRPLAELILQFEHPSSTNKQMAAKDDFSLLSPTKMISDSSNKENCVTISPVFTKSVAEIASKFTGNSTVKNRDDFFQTLVERRKEELKHNSAFKAMPAGDMLKDFSSPVKAEFMKAWVEDVIAQGDSGSPDIGDAEEFLAELGLKETTVGTEEWNDWSEAMRAAHSHGLSKSPAPAHPLRTVELDSSIDAYSISISPTKARNRYKNEVSFDVDEEGASYEDYMMSQYHADDDILTIRSQSLESINLHAENFVCPVVRISEMSESCDSLHGDIKASNKSDQKRVPKSCMSWFGCN